MGSFNNSVDKKEFLLRSYWITSKKCWRAKKVITTEKAELWEIKNKTWLKHFELDKNPRRNKMLCLVSLFSNFFAINFSKIKSSFIAFNTHVKNTM